MVKIKKRQAVKLKSRQELKQDLKQYYILLWITLILLCCVGLVMIYSASSYEAVMQEGGRSFSDVLSQLKFIVLGFGAAFIIQFLDYQKLSKLYFLPYLLAYVCIFLLRTKLGEESNGATRWLRITESVQFQVAELVKIAVIICIAFLACRLRKHADVPKATLILWIAGGVPAFLLFKISNDLSSAIVVLGITFGISLIAMKTMKMHAAAFVLAAAGAGGYVWSIARNMPSPEEIKDLPFRVARIAAWLDPERYAMGKGYQVLQSLYAVGSGGFFGRGLGNSIQKRGFIPEAKNDMIFSIILEELGVFGALIIISLIVYLLYLIVQAFMHASDMFGSMMAAGVFMHIATQTIINMAVNVSLFPNTGIALPFISSGGTAIFLLLVEGGMVINIIRRSINRIPEEEI